MVEIIVISFVAFFTAILTFFSGFGLGTILMPVFAIFFPVDVAIALTGVVHFVNNLFKMALVGKMASRKVLIRFGIPAVLASFAGAWVLLRIAGMPVLHSYELMGRTWEITPVKLIIAILLLFFSILEILPQVRNFAMEGKWQVAGGLLSGFFGGLAGIQGAFRTAFLIKSGLTKEAFIATGVIIASLVDITRLSVYASRMRESGFQENSLAVIFAVTAAITGTILGNRLLKKIEFRTIRILVSIMLMIISVGLMFGFI